METTRNRPSGVSIIVILLMVQGVLEVAYGLLAPILLLSPHSSVVAHVSPWGFLFSGIIALILGYGLWTLQRWAFWVTVALEAINLIGGIIALFSYYYPGAVLLSMVIPAVILIYFFADRNVLSAFNIRLV